MAIDFTEKALAPFAQNVPQNTFGRRSSRRRSPGSSLWHRVGSAPSAAPLLQSPRVSVVSRHHKQHGQLADGTEFMPSELHCDADWAVESGVGQSTWVGGSGASGGAPPRRSRVRSSGSLGQGSSPMGVQSLLNQRCGATAGGGRRGVIGVHRQAGSRVKPFQIPCATWPRPGGRSTLLCPAAVASRPRAGNA